MRLGINDSGQIITTSDSGEVLTWAIPVSDRAELGSNLFRDINAFWAELPPQNRMRISETYKAIAEAFDNILDTGRLATVLIKLIQNLYAEIPLDRLSFWIDRNDNIIYPPSEALLNEHDIHDQNPGRTYIRKDYVGLVHLTIALRPMVPIWGEYLRRIKTDSGTEYKEYAAFFLISATPLVTWGPLERLRVYADALITSENKKGVAHIMTGLGSEETIEWMVSRICTRRLTVVNVDASTTGAGNIITNVHGYVTNALRDLDRNFGGHITNKKPDDQVSDEESSIMERYKVKQSVSMGDIEMYSVYCADTQRVARHIDPTVPPELVKHCVEIAMGLETMMIYTHHLTLVQWVVRSIIPPEAVPCLSKRELLGVMGAVQAVLWHWGFVEIAAWITSVAIPGSDAEIHTLEVRHRLSSEYVNKLMQLYPHVDLSDKQKGSDRKQNFAAQAIEKLTDEMVLNRWVFSAPAALVQAVNVKQGFESTRGVSVPANIMELLALLVIFLAEKERG